MTVGEGFPDLAERLSAFRHAFDWSKAKAEGRVIPSRGADPLYDRAQVRSLPISPHISRLP